MEVRIHDDDEGTHLRSRADLDALVCRYRAAVAEADVVADLQHRSRSRSEVRGHRPRVDGEAVADPDGSALELERWTAVDPRMPPDPRTPSQPPRGSGRHETLVNRHRSARAGWGSGGGAIRSTRAGMPPAI